MSTHIGPCGEPQCAENRPVSLADSRGLTSAAGSRIARAFERAGLAIGQSNGAFIATVAPTLEIPAAVLDAYADPRGYRP